VLIEAAPLESRHTVLDQPMTHEFHPEMSVELALPVLIGNCHHFAITYHQFLVRCQSVTYIPQWCNSLLLDFIVLAKEGVKKDGEQDCNSRSSSCHDQYIFPFVSRNNPL